MAAGSDEPMPLEERVRRWQAGEDRLYPLVLVRPEAYAAAVTLVRAVADRLGTISSLEELAAADDNAAALVVEVVRDSGVPAEGLDLGLVAAAGFNLRYRDLRVAAQREQAKERIRAAAGADRRWVVLFESGDPDRAPLAPYRRLEMRLPDGFGIHASITADPGTGQAVYGIETVQLDPATGDWVPEARPGAGSQTCPSRADWDRTVERLKAQDPPPQPPS